jgi:ABC-type transport system involved in cytochrome c biogenesis permease component
MRWLLLKDLQILKRSPLLVAVLVAYSVVVSLVAGAALSSGPSKPKVAFANLVPADQSEVALGGRRVDASKYAQKLFDKVDPIRVKTREEAIAKVKSGEALGALVVPADVTQKLQGTLGLSGSGRPTVEVYYNAENPLKRQYVEDTIESTLADANAAISTEVLKESARYLNVLVAGGRVGLPIVGKVDILGLRRSRAIIEAAIAGLPEGAPERATLEQVSRFANLAAENLDLSKPILASISAPVQVKQTVVSGSSSSFSAFAAEAAVVGSMMFVALLLAAGMLALEREENAFGRLVRGLITRTGLVTEKVGLAALAAFVLTAVMLGILGALIGLDFGRAPLWLVALALGAAAFGAMGVAIGGVTREVRSASLAAFVVSLPVAALALVPSGAVSEGLYDVIRVISGAFPFRPCLLALDAAISGGTLLAPLLHLAALTLAFGAIARISLRRFA